MEFVRTQLTKRNRKSSKIVNIRYNIKEQAQSDLINHMNGNHVSLVVVKAFIPTAIVEQGWGGPLPHPEGFTHHVYLLARIDHCSARSAAACRHTDSDVTSSRPGISSHEKFAHGSRSP